MFTERFLAEAEGFAKILNKRGEQLYAVKGMHAFAVLAMTGLIDADGTPGAFAPTWPALPIQHQWAFAYLVACLGPVAMEVRTTEDLSAATIDKAVEEAMQTAFDFSSTAVEKLRAALGELEAQDPDAAHFSIREAIDLLPVNKSELGERQQRQAEDRQAVLDAIGAAAVTAGATIDAILKATNDTGLINDLAGVRSCIDNVQKLAEQE